MKNSAVERFGVVAEEVAEVDENLVVYDSEGKAGISITSLVYYLVRAVQELGEEINTLKNKITDLENKLGDAR